MTQPIICNYFLFSLSPLTKDDLKANKSLESYNKFASGRVKEVKIKLFFKSPAEIALVTGWVSM